MTNNISLQQLQLELGKADAEFKLALNNYNNWILKNNYAENKKLDNELTLARINKEKAEKAIIEFNWQKYEI